MAFTEYKNLATVLKEFSLHYQEQALDYDENLLAPPSLASEITFNLTELAYDSSEAMLCETLIFPILKTAWKPFIHDLMLWSHQAIEFNNKLSGIPDYLFAKKSSLGKVVMDKPFVAIVEAKKDDFSAGWGQCAAEMYTATQLNENPAIQVFGIVSNGKFWEFASLQNSVFFKYQQNGNVYQLDALFAMLCAILKNCQLQLQAA